MHCRECGTTLTGDNSCRDCGTPAGPDTASTAGTRSQPANGQESTVSETADTAVRRVGPVPILPRRSLLAGIAAFVVGYALTGLFFLLEVLPAVNDRGDTASDVVASLIDQIAGTGGQAVVDASGGPVPLLLRTVGWTFFSAQQIPLTGTARGFGTSTTVTIDVLTVASDVPDVPLTPPLYYLVPPVCLFVAGWWLARPHAGTLAAQVGESGHRQHLRALGRGALVGAQLLVGYLGCMGIAAVFLKLTVDDLPLIDSVTAEPALTEALLWGGGYAIVAGAVGGAVAVVVKRRKQQE